MMDEDNFTSAYELETPKTELERQNAQLLSKLEKIQSLQNKYQNLYDSAPVGYLVLDTNYIILESNLTFAGMLGYDRESLLGTRFDRYISSTSLQVFSRKFRKTFATGCCHNCLIRMLRKDGSILYAGFESAIVCDTDRNQNLCHLAVADIYRYKSVEAKLAKIRGEMESRVQSRTRELKEAYRRLSEELSKQKEAEEYLKQCNEFSNGLLKNSPNPIVVTNMDTSIQYVNPAFEDLTGFTITEITGKKSPYPWWPPDMIQQYEEENTPGSRAKALNPLERRYQKKTGETLWISLNIKPITEKSQTKGFLANWVDITERKKSEDQIEQSKRRIEKLFHLMAEGAILWDNSLHITQLNTEAERIFGMKREEMEGQPYKFSKWSVSPPWKRVRSDETPMPEEELAAFLAQKKKREVRNIEFGHKWPDGTIIWIYASAVPILDASGNIDSILCTFTDITEQKKLREDREYYLSQMTIIQEEERKRISRELHDDTAQYLSLLSLELDALASKEEKLSPEVIDTLKRLHSSAEQAVQKVRRFSHELHPSVLENFGLVAALELLVSEFNQQKDIKARFNSVGEEKRLSGEAELAFFRVAQESLSNIRKHSKARQAGVMIKYLSRKVRLSITDNGMGFKVEKESYIAARRGSLGLISMRERAALIGAILKINSRPEKGTSIMLELKY